MKKNSLVITGLIVAMCMLTGCISFPTIGKEDGDRIANYATALLLKYDANYKTRLVDTAAIEKERAIQAAIDAEKAAAEKAKQEEEATAAAALQENNMEGTATESFDVNLAEVLDVSNVAIEYSYFEVCDAYPAVEENTIIGQVLPTPGSHLLLVHFTVTNTTTQKQDVKLINPEVVYRISVNEASANNVLTTIEPGDFTCFQDTLEPGQMVDLVLIVETKISTIEDVQKLLLTIFKNGATTKINLGV